MADRCVRKEPFELRMEDNLVLRGEVRVPEDTDSPGAALIVCHGFKAFKDWGFYPYIGDWFASKGLYTVTFNFSMNGVRESDFDELDKFARNTYTREQADIGEIHAALLQNGLPLADRADHSRIALLGHSRGGGNAILYAAAHPDVRAVVTWNGIGSVNLFDPAFEAEARRSGVAYTRNTRTKQDMPIEASFFEDIEANRDRFDIPARLRRLSSPALLIQGSLDGERLLDGFRVMQEAAPGQRYVQIPETGHTFDAVHPFAGTTPALDRALEESLSFLSNVL